MLPSCGFVLLYLVTRSEAATLVTDAVVRVRPLLVELVFGLLLVRFS